MTDANLGMDRPTPWAREPVETTGKSNPAEDMMSEIAELRARVAVQDKDIEVLQDAMDAAEADRERMRAALRSSGAGRSGGEA